MISELLGNQISSVKHFVHISSGSSVSIMCDQGAASKISVLHSGNSNIWHVAATKSHPPFPCTRVWLSWKLSEPGQRERMNTCHAAMSDQSGQLQKINRDNLKWMSSSLSQAVFKKQNLFTQYSWKVELSGIHGHNWKVMDERWWMQIE